MSINKNYSESYLLEQISAMRWLREQGLSCEQIRDLTWWGSVDETERVIKAPTPVTSLKIDLKTGEVTRSDDIKLVKIPIKGSDHEWFFLKSKYLCPWMFTERPIKSWHKEGSREARFPLEAVENYTKSVFPSVNYDLLEKVESLTKALEFGSIEVSILNITNSETKEPTREMTKV